MAISVTTKPVQELIDAGVLFIGDGYRAKNEELSKKGLPFAMAQNIYGGFRFEGADCFPNETLFKVGNKISQAGDVVFTSKGTVGRFAFVGESIPQFVYSPQLCFWRSLDHKQILPLWLFYWMHGHEFFQQYKGVAGQTDMAEYVSLRDQRSMYISLPPHNVQKSIAHILGALDDKIELNRRMNETLEDMARAIFKSWFVDFDPVRAKLSGESPESICRRLGLTPEILDFFPDSLQDSELGEIPEGWKVKSLDRIATYLNGLALQKYPAGKGDWLPVIKIAQLRTGDTVGADRANTELPDEYVVKNGDVLFSWSGSLLVKIWCGGRGALNQHLFKVTSNLYPKWFLYMWTKQHLPMFREIAANKATTMGHIQRKHLAEAKALIPRLELLEGMTCIFQPLIEKFIKINLENSMLAKVRDTLVPKLFSCEFRVGTDENGQEAAL